MTHKTSDELLTSYYARTADQYDRWHFDSSEHNVALRLISGLVDELGLRSILDIAGGTGRGWRYLKRAHPQLNMRTNDLSMALIGKAIENGVTKENVEIASAYALPYADGAFDFVIELGALHHMAHPNLAVTEMLRVARVGIAIHDSNMYVTGIGRRTLLRDNLIGALIKYCLVESGLLTWIKRLAYRREYSVTEGDGVFYTMYSVFQTAKQLRASCARIFVIPTVGTQHRDSVPLLGASHCLLIALKADVA